jgi:TM2 domain-containing membrane protein YozV
VCLRRVNRTPYCEGCAAGRAEQHPWLAAVFGLCFPGLGQVYNGQIGLAVGCFLGSPVFGITWVGGAIYAAIVAEQIHNGERSAATVPTGVVLVVLKIGLVVGPILAIGLIMLIVAAAMAAFG